MLYLCYTIPYYPTLQVVAHESECRAVAFSQELGLIATVDVFGELCVWDYQQFSLRFIFKVSYYTIILLYYAKLC
jgi:hypothetical protein